MSETLHKLQVVIEGNSSKLTQATREAMQETRRMTNGIQCRAEKDFQSFCWHEEQSCTGDYPRYPGYDEADADRCRNEGVYRRLQESLQGYFRYRKRTG